MNTVSLGVQTDPTRLDNLLFTNKLHESKQKTLLLEAKILYHLRKTLLKESEAAKRIIHLYTGLPNAEVLHTEPPLY